MRKIIILGSSGSIGIQTVDIAYKMRSSISVEGLSVCSNIDILKKQIIQLKPKAVCIEDSGEKAQSLRNWIKSKKLKIRVFSGKEGLDSLVSECKADIVVAAIVGSVGLSSIIKAIKSKKNIAIANKEALVVAGQEIMRIAKQNNVSILPVDSEHSAIFQCCEGKSKSQIKNIILTASGGPFYKYNKSFDKIKAKQALKHPTWNMGKKITIDSATLMNKGLEAIEASVLFDIPIDRIKIVIHPQSIVHSMVEYIDGSIIAQLSLPDMRLPIQYALTYPDRKISCSGKNLDLTEIGELEFFKPDFKKFPCLTLAYNAAKIGKSMPAVLNAANEVAVKMFLNGQILFTDISKTVSNTMQAHKLIKNPNIDDLTNADIWARSFAEKYIYSRLTK
jgi:1-deoxy-D-xylulose-5-phosphate reductoisomerase